MTKASLHVAQYDHRMYHRQFGFESCLKDVINQTSEFESQREFEGEVAGEKLDILREIWRLERSRLTR